MLLVTVCQVTWAVQALLKQQGWSTLPLFALGGSSGGALVMLLALRIQLQVRYHALPSVMCAAQLAVGCSAYLLECTISPYASSVRRLLQS